MEQLIIKILLIIVFIAFSLALFNGARNPRSQALRTIGIVIFLFCAIFAVIFPAIVDRLAAAVGVGRGTDLLLYGFIILFIGSALTGIRIHREQERKLTELTRHVALMHVTEPDPHKTDNVQPAESSANDTKSPLL